jgi:CheY-like chemotaxis protein
MYQRHVTNQPTNRLPTVLVVEDSADDVRLLERASRRMPTSLAFHSVPNGETAIAYLKGEGDFADRQAHPLPDLVLLDIGLPGMDGFEVLTWIRSHPELKDLKVFVWTDSGQPEVLDRATQAGANRFVPKSVAFVRGGLAGLINGIAQSIQPAANQQALAQARATS